MFSNAKSNCLLFILLLIGGCDEDCILNCPPVAEEGELIIRVTIDEENLRVPVAIFSGDFEDGNVLINDTLSTISKTYLFPPGEYSATSRYSHKNGTITIIAVDGGEIYVRDESCETLSCAKMIALKLNLELVE